MADEDLREAFDAFCAFGGGKVAEFDIVKFAKFARDTNLLNKTTFTTVDIDLIFSKVKAKGERKINYETFRRRAIPLIAQKKRLLEEELVGFILSSRGPRSTGTRLHAVRLHDDKMSYTGVYANGGPTNVDLATSDLKYITNRSPADVRGVNLVPAKHVSFL